MNSGPKNEDQSLFTQSLPQGLSCDDQGWHSKRPTLPDQLWAHFVGVRIFIYSSLLVVALSLLGMLGGRFCHDLFVLDAPGEMMVQPRSLEVSLMSSRVALAMRADLG
jgi:hypothetical protein